MARDGFLGVGVAGAVLGEEPLQDSRPWVRGCEQELSTYDHAASKVSVRKRQAESSEEQRDSIAKA